MKYVIERLTGINRDSGALMNDHDHLLQSINDILTTPIGTRVMRREYGSNLHDLLDKPISETVIMHIYAATVVAILRWDPRVRFNSVNVEFNSGGSMTLTLDIERVTEHSRENYILKIEFGNKGSDA